MKEFKPQEIDWSKIDYHVYEELDMEFEYLVRIQGECSYQEYQVSGEYLEEFMLNVNMNDSDVFVYKLVKSYEQMDV